MIVGDNKKTMNIVKHKVYCVSCRSIIKKPSTDKFPICSICEELLEEANQYKTSKKVILKGEIQYSINCDKLVQLKTIFNDCAKNFPEFVVLLTKDNNTYFFRLEPAGSKFSYLEIPANIIKIISDERIPIVIKFSELSAAIKVLNKKTTDLILDCSIMNNIVYLRYKLNSTIFERTMYSTTRLSVKDTDFHFLDKIDSFPLDSNFHIKNEKEMEQLLELFLQAKALDIKKVPTIRILLLDNQLMLKSKDFQAITDEVKNDNQWSVDISTLKNKGLIRKKDQIIGATYDYETIKPLLNFISTKKKRQLVSTLDLDFSHESPIRWRYLFADNIKLVCLIAPMQLDEDEEE